MTGDSVKTSEQNDIKPKSFRYIKGNIVGGIVGIGTSYVALRYICPSLYNVCTFFLGSKDSIPLNLATIFLLVSPPLFFGTSGIKYGGIAEKTISEKPEITKTFVTIKNVMARIFHFELKKNPVKILLPIGVAAASYLRLLPKPLIVSQKQVHVDGIGYRIIRGTAFVINKVCRNNKNPINVTVTTGVDIGKPFIIWGVNTQLVMKTLSRIEPKGKIAKAMMRASVVLSIIIVWEEWQFHKRKIAMNLTAIAEKEKIATQGTITKYESTIADQNEKIAQLRASLDEEKKNNTNLTEVNIQVSRQLHQSQASTQGIFAPTPRQRRQAANDEITVTCGNTL